MDIYGAFQFCSIAVLAAPHVVRLSIASFSGPGKYIALSETALLLAGMLFDVQIYQIKVDSTAHQCRSFVINRRILQGDTYTMRPKCIGQLHSIPTNQSTTRKISTFG
jgi:hypothetical protein